MDEPARIELTILMPCLDEAETIGTCVKKAKKFLDSGSIYGEVLVADNGSTDRSPEIAEAAGARVVTVPEKGYGAALIGGTKAARGKYVIMGDADDSYDFLSLWPFVHMLREGYPLVMGNRYEGGIDPGAMPWSHRHIGTPVLSFIGRLFYGGKIKDFNCGLRGYDREKIMSLNLSCTGMEYASEMIVKARLADMSIAQVPTTLHKDGRSRPPHLRSFRDGWRHLKFLLEHAPDWLFLYPGMILCAGGIGTMLSQAIGLAVPDGFIDLEAAAFVAGTCAMEYAALSKVHAAATGYVPVPEGAPKGFSPNGAIFGGAAVFAVAVLVYALQAIFGRPSGGRWGILAASVACTGIQTMFAGFMAEILSRTPRGNGNKNKKEG